MQDLLEDVTLVFVSPEHIIIIIIIIMFCDPMWSLCTPYSYIMTIKLTNRKKK